VNATYISENQTNYTMKETRIIGLLIRDRIKEAGRTQLTLSKFAHLIKSRLGFHELNENTCSRTGVIILQMAGNPEEWNSFEKEIQSIGGVEMQKMSFVY
jgi:metal-responsive CopG/Arc/MetJ family transcriptional regulator